MWRIYIYTYTHTHTHSHPNKLYHHILKFYMLSSIKKHDINLTYLLFYTVTGKHILHVIQEVTDGVHVV